MQLRRILKDRSHLVGEFALPDGVTGRVLEPAGTRALDAPIAVHPAGTELETTFPLGPTFVLFIPGGYVDPATGCCFTRERAVVRESVVLNKFAEGAAEKWSSLDFDSAYPIRSGDIAVALDQRAANYCRWWLDAASKLFLFEKYRPLSVASHPIATTLTPLSGPQFQQATLEMLGYPPGPALAPGRLLQGNLLVSSGLTYKGGQNISSLAAEFGAFAVGRSGIDAAAAADTARRRLYVSRSLASMRRVQNEAELLPGLAERGFEVVTLESLSLPEQVLLFATAELIVSPHGAGLTNVLFCAPGTKLLEIFPDSGVHGSAFRRLATHLGLPYGLFAGTSLVTKQQKNNPNNADISVERDSFLAMVDEMTRAAPARGAVRSSEPRVKPSEKQGGVLGFVLPEAVRRRLS